MSAKATASKGKPARASRSRRKRIASGKRHQQELNGPVKPSAGKSSSSMRNSEPPALAISMAGRPGIHVDLMTLPEGACLLDSEQKILQALEDLLPLTARCKEFKDNTRWSKDSSVADVFHTFYLKVLKMLHAKRDVEYMQIIHKEGVYKLAVKRAVYFDVSCPVFPVCFIPPLEKVKKDLFDLCFYMVVLLNREADIALWEEDNDNYIYGSIEENLAEYKTYGDTYQKEVKALEEAYVAYGPAGAATLFCDRLNKVGASKRFWLKKFDEYKPKTAIEKDCHKLLSLGRELLIEGKSMNQFVSLPPEYEENNNGYDDEIPSTPENNVRFLWSANDWWFGEFEGMESSIAQNVGAVPFYVDHELESIAQLNSTKDTFPAKLLRFMAEGRAFEKKYRPVLADPEKLKQAFTPKPKPLIDYL